MDHYADDLAALTAQLDLHDAVHVGHSTGGGEVMRYLGRHGEERAAKAAMISAVPPLMVQTEANPGGCPRACSTACRPSWPRTVRSSTGSWPRDRSTGTTRRAWNRRRRSSRTGGAKE